MSISEKDPKFDQDIDLIISEKNGRKAIYLSNLEAAQNLNTLNQLNIQAIVSVAKGGFLTHSQSQVPNYFYIPAVDDKGFDISAYFDKTFDFIDRNRRKSNVLIHCIAGISRSATIVIAYLMRNNNMTLVQSYSEVKRMRPIIRPNQGFMRQLSLFQERLKSNNIQLPKESRISHMRNKSSSIIRFSSTDQRKLKLLATAEDSQGKIKRINLEQKRNELKQKFGMYLKKQSCNDSSGNKQKTPFLGIGSIVLGPNAIVSGDEPANTKGHIELRRKISLDS